MNAPASLSPPAPSPPSYSALGESCLQVVYAWRRHLLGHRLLRKGESLTVGPVKSADFVAPQLPGCPARLRVLAPVPGGFRLRLAPGMSGWVETRALGRKDVAELLQILPARKRLFGTSPFRDIDLLRGECGVVGLDAAGTLRLQLSYVELPEKLGAPDRRKSEPFFYRVVGVTALVLGLFALVLMLVADKLDVTYPPVLTEERVVEVVAPVLETPKMQAVKKQQGEKKRQEKEAAMSKKMKDTEGKLGRKDADKSETTLPKGERDILREKVSQVGVLSILGSARAGGSGLGKLLDTSAPDDLDQAVTGLQGATLAVGRGAGGLGNAGTGLGGGGTGFGRIQGSGNLDLGAGRGTGRKGGGLGTGTEKSVSVGLDTGKADANGGLTKEQIERVVISHMAALKYCYEKELQRKPNLAGKIELRWLIRADGQVDRVNTTENTMGDKEVDSCMLRQVKSWRFPKASAPTLVQRFPFFFKGGA